MLIIHEYIELVPDPFPRARESRHARGVAYHESAAGGIAFHRTRRRRPRSQAVLVADKNRLAAAIDHGIVAERCQPVLAAVLRPCGGAPARAQDGAAALMAEQVD